MDFLKISVVKFVVITLNCTHTLTVYMCEVSDQRRHRGSRDAALKVHFLKSYNSRSNDAIMLKLRRLLDIGKSS